MTTTEFVGEHGGPARSSASSARPRRYHGVERIVLPREQVDAWAVAPRGPASALAVDPSGLTLIARHDNCVVIVEPYGVRQHVGPEAGHWQVLATHEGLVYGPRLHAWTEPLADTLGGTALFGASPHRQLTVALGPSRWLTVVQALPTWGEAELWLESRPRGEAPDALRWRTRLPGEGVAAIDAAGHLAVAGDERLRVYAPEGRDRRGVTTLDRPLRPRTYGVSAAAPTSSRGWIVVAAAEHGPAVPEDRARRRRMQPRDRLRQRWHTWVDAIDPAGSPSWSTPLPFEVTLPAIWGGDARRYFVGRGLAALDDGRVRWQQASDAPMTAAAFGDGSLAVASGHHVWIVDVDGRRQQTFTLSPDERVIAQPAISSDGTVYLATDTKLYAIR